MHSEFARFVRCRRNYAPLVALPSDDYGFALQRGIEQLFHRDEERVHIDVKDGFAGRGHKEPRRSLEELYQRGTSSFLARLTSIEPILKHESSYPYTAANAGF